MVWIIGAGNMAREYVRVLTALGRDCLVIGRSDARAKLLAEEMQVEAVGGGLESFLRTKPAAPEHAIVCTPVDNLAAVSLQLMRYDVNSILIEKPAAMDLDELGELIELADQSHSNVVIGYNRRFYQSVLKMEQLIQADGGLCGCHFEITEWGHRVVDAPSSETVKRKWLLANTSHVIDLAFFEAGFPTELTTYTAGGLEWHPSASRFCGAGVGSTGALLSYMGYWDGPGRWSLEFVTLHNRYILRPMEKLAVQKLGEISIADVPGIDYAHDENFKPGIYLQTQSFLTGDVKRFCSLQQQRQALGMYARIAAYEGS